MSVCLDGQVEKIQAGISALKTSTLLYTVIPLTMEIPELDKAAVKTRMNSRNGKKIRQGTTDDTMNDGKRLMLGPKDFAKEDKWLALAGFIETLKCSISNAFVRLS